MKFGKVSLNAKIIVTSAVPFFVLLVLLTKSKQENIDFAAKEKAGNSYLRPLVALLTNVSLHKLAVVRNLSGNEVNRSVLTSLEAKVDRGIDDLLAVDKNLGELLQFTDEGLRKRNRDQSRAEVLRRDWQELKAQGQTLSESAANKSHNKLIATIRSMISHAGDTSNLILDPDLDSYYTMDLTLLAVPQMLDRLQEVSATIEPILRRKLSNDQDRLGINVAAALLKQSDSDRIVSNIQTALNEDQNFYGVSESFAKNVPGALSEFSSSTASMLKLLGNISGSSQIKLSPAEVRETLDRAIESTYRLWTVSTDELDRFFDNRMRVLEREKWIALLLSVLAQGFAVLVSFFVARSVNQNIRTAVEKLRLTTQKTYEFSSALVGSSQELSASSSQQASAIQETVATLNEINSMVSMSVEHANNSSAAARTSLEAATRGSSSVNEMIRALEDISHGNDDIMRQINESNQKIMEISKVIGDISNKTEVINDIVFQTKLLSFNASIEAARAGEHGKGFAVVAEEVGDLAQMSGAASKEIADTLSASMERVESIVGETRKKVEGLIAEGKVRMEKGSSVALQCGKIIEEIVRVTNETNAMTNEILKASKEQATGIREITNAMNQFDQTTHQNEIVAHDTAKAAESLSTQSNILQDAVSGLEEMLSKKKTKHETPVESPVGAIAPEAGNVIPLKPRSQTTGKTSEKASGSMDVPSRSDARFKDV